MSRVLVTGGAGFIGCNLAQKLLEQGKKVVVLDDFSRKGTELNYNWLKKNYPDVGLVKADISRDKEKILKAVTGSESVYHLAAQVAVTTSVTDPVRDFEVNALGTFNVLEAVRKNAGDCFFVYASTNKVYGSLEDESVLENEKSYFFENLKSGISEKKPLDFHSPYGCSKGSADQYVRDYSRIYGIDTVVMRQSCIYGPRQFGVEDQGWIAWFTIASLLGKPVRVYGTGKQARDILHVDDLVSAFILAKEKRNISKGKIYNIGGGPKNTLSILEFFDILEKYLGRKVSFKKGPIRPGDQKIFVSDNSKIEKELSWKPQTGKTEGIKKFFDWATKNISEIKAVMK